MRAIAAIATIFVLLIAAAQAKPRAVSLDYCADQYLLLIGDPAQIAALSRGADKDYSYLRTQAEAHRKVRPTIEEVLSETPDIVLRQWGGGANASEAFSRFGAQTVSLGFPQDFDGVKDNIRITAAALQQEHKGEALIRELDRRLDHLKAQGRSSAPTHALYVTPGGVTAGAQTMINAIIEAAGMVNIAAQNGQSYWPPLPAEALLLDPPDFIVAGFFGSQDEYINHWSAARHPALLKIIDETPGVHLSADVISCASFHSVEAAEAIAGAVREQTP
ncbi:MAG: ABC transporter substrate-binding protein [Pseudomonadota bacterium]